MTSAAKLLSRGWYLALQICLQIWAAWTVMKRYSAHARNWYFTEARRACQLPQAVLRFGPSPVHDLWVALIALIYAVFDVPVPGADVRRLRRSIESTRSAAHWSLPQLSAMQTDINQ